LKKLKFYGLGGQGVVSAGKILSSAVSLHEGGYAITIPAYGHERRGAPVFTDVILSNDPILLNCFVYDPDIVVVMDERIIERNIDIAKGISEDTILVLNARNQEVADAYKKRFAFKNIYYVDATQIALDNIGRGIPNSSSLGALAKTGVVSIESIEKALIEFFKGEAGVKNAKAARDSYEQTNKI